MQRTPVLIASLAVAVLTISSLARAADMPMEHGKAMEKFKLHDTDKDGTLDKTEAKAMPFVDRNFDAIDTDKDGTISMEEVMAFSKAKMRDMHAKGEARFKAADKDGDGTLDQTEAKAMPHVAKHFADIDADKDGTVSMEEIHTFMKAHREHHEK